MVAPFSAALDAQPVASSASNSSALALEVRGLSHAYGGQGGVEVLHDVSLQVYAGEVVAVTGPSGSGKSTLLHLLAGLNTFQRGEVYWGGVAVHLLNAAQRSERRAQQLGLIFQHHYLLPDLTVLENLLIPAQIAHQGWHERAAQLLLQVGLQGRESAYPEVLSGGERQRVAVARALMARPAALLADEPTGSLDRANAHTVAGLMLSLAREQGAGVLLVTHDEEMAANADRRIHLLDGRVVTS